MLLQNLKCYIKIHMHSNLDAPVYKWWVFYICDTIWVRGINMHLCIRKASITLIRYLNFSYIVNQLPLTWTEVHVSWTQLQCTICIVCINSYYNTRFVRAPRIRPQGKYKYCPAAWDARAAFAAIVVSFWVPVRGTVSTDMRVSHLKRLSCNTKTPCDKISNGYEKPPSC